MGGTISNLVFMPPDSADLNQTFVNEFGRDIHEITTNGGTKICVLYINKNLPYTILYSHGNAEDIVLSANSLEKLRRICDCNLVAYDYPGYGLSEGKPSEQGTYDCVTSVYNWLVSTQGIAPNKIILFGRSLGSGPTIELASKTRNLAGLILQSPLKSIIATQTQRTESAADGKSYSFSSSISKPFDMFKNDSKISTIIDYPIYIIHGSIDNVVPYWHGVWFYNEFKKISQCAVEKHWVEHCGHNDIEYNKGREYRLNLRHFLDTYVFSNQNRNGNNINESKSDEKNNDSQNDSKTAEEELDASKDSSLLYYEDLEKFQKLCMDSVKNANFANNDNNENQNNVQTSYANKLFCCKLSKWIYEETTETQEITKLQDNLPHFMKHLQLLRISSETPHTNDNENNNNNNQDKNSDKNQRTQEPVTRWALLLDNSNNNNNIINIYLVYRGTKLNDIKDLISDANIKLLPLLRDSNNKPEISVHSGLHASVMRDFETIWNIISTRCVANSNVNNATSLRLNVTGHGLGGGLAILFGLQSICNGLIPNVINSNSVNIITYGAPSVVAFDKIQVINNVATCLDISKSNENIVNTLGAMTYNIINRFDFFPRMLLSGDWIEKITYAMIRQRVGKTGYYEGAVKNANSRSGKFTSISRSMQSLESMQPYIYSYVDLPELSDLIEMLFNNSNLMRLINNYQAIGNYYVFFSNLEDYCYVPHTFSNDKNKFIRDLLSYIPKNCEITDYFNFGEVMENHNIKEYLPLLANLNIKTMKNGKNVTKNENNKNNQNDNVKNPKLELDGYMKSIVSERENAKECASGLLWNNILTKHVSKDVKYILQTHKMPSTKSIRLTSVSFMGPSWAQNARIICEMKDKKFNKTMYRLIDVNDDISELKRKMQLY